MIDFDFKRVIGVAVAGLVVAGGIALGFCIKRIPTGYVGVQYSVRGGVQEELLTQGWHIVAPTKKVSLYSIATEQLYMSADKKDGSKDDDSFTIKCNDGTLNVDFEMAYSFDSERVVDLFSKYRGLDGEDVVNTKIRGRIKTLASEVTSQYSVLEVHMEKVPEVNRAITTHLNNSLGEYGIRVESATLSRTQPSEAVEQAIVNRTKKAQELEAEKLEQEKIRLEQETAIIKAEGEKKVEILKAEAEAEANEIINRSINENLLKKMEMEARLKHGWVEVNGASAVVK